MAMARRVSGAGNKEGNGKGRKSNGNGNKEGKGKGGKSNGGGDKKGKEEDDNMGNAYSNGGCRQAMAATMAMATATTWVMAMMTMWQAMKRALVWVAKVIAARRVVDKQWWQRWRWRRGPPERTWPLAL